jgi:hypothetical protein
MSDFRVHPVLKSPGVAAVFFGVVASGLFDVGIADGLRTIEESKITVDDWGKLNEARYALAFISALLAGFAWWSFRIGREQIKVPLAGIALGVIGSAMGIALIWSLLHSIHMPEYEQAADLIWRFAYLWSGLVALSIIGCLRLALWVWWRCPSSGVFGLRFGPIGSCGVRREAGCRHNAGGSGGWGISCPSASFGDRLCSGANPVDGAGEGS